VRVNRLLVSVFLLVASTLPVFAFNISVVFIPTGHWEYEEKITVRYNSNGATPSTDRGINSISEPCYGFSISSNRKHLSDGPSNTNGFSTVDLGINGEESNGFRVKWTWVPPVQNPNLPPTSFDITSTAYTSVSVIEGSSPPENNDGHTAGATATVVGPPSSVAKTYGNGPGTYSGMPDTLIETIATNGQKTSKVNAHTVAFVRDPSQHFTASSWLIWGYQ
jgi:hypothetical protein